MAHDEIDLHGGMSRSKTKTLIVVFFDSRGIVHKDYLVSGEQLIIWVYAGGGKENTFLPTYFEKKKSQILSG